MHRTAKDPRTEEEAAGLAGSWTTSVFEFDAGPSNLASSLITASFRGSNFRASWRSRKGRESVIVNAVNSDWPTDLHEPPIFSPKQLEPVLFETMP